MSHGLQLKKHRITAMETLQTRPYPHAGYLVVKAMVTKETAASSQFLRHFPETSTKKQLKLLLLLLFIVSASFIYQRL